MGACCCSSNSPFGERLSLRQFSVNELSHASASIDLQTAIGADRLNARVCVGCTGTHYSLSFSISNLTLVRRNGNVSKVWKAAYVFPQHEGGDTSLAKNLEKLINIQMLPFLPEQCILNPHTRTLHVDSCM